MGPKHATPEHFYFANTASPDDKTAIELFLAGIRGWEVEAGRVLVGATDSKQL
jgi:hypothetical protein